MKKYREYNKDKTQERNKMYYEDNQDKIRESKKNYYEANKEKKIKKSPVVVVVLLSKNIFRDIEKPRDILIY